MAIELTTAPLSAQIGINNALRVTYASGIPALDGFVPNGNIYCFCDALEGDSVPDGASATYTKTYNLSANIPWGYVIFVGNTGSTNLHTTQPSLGLRSTYFGELTGSYNASSSTDAGSVYTIFDTAGIGLYVNHSYFDAKTLFASGQTDRDKNEDGSQRPPSFLKTYTQLGNTLVGYYSGLSNIGFVQRQARSVLKSAWLDGQNLVMSFKKFASTSSVQFNNDKFCVFW